MPTKISQKHIPYHRWRREEIIQAIKQRVRQKLSLSKVEVDRDEPALSGAAYLMFGSWRKARQAAKITPDQFRLRFPKWSPEKIIAALREWHRHNPIQPPPLSKPYKRLEYLWHIALKYFPSRKFVMRKFGIPIWIKTNRSWTPEKVIKCLQERVRRGKPINTMTILKENRFIYRAARTTFGSYRAAVKAAGFNYKRICCQPWTRPLVIKRLRARLRQGGRLTRVRREDRLLYAAAYREFGSFAQAVQAAGLSYGRK